MLCFYTEHGPASRSRDPRSASASNARPGRERALCPNIPRSSRRCCRSRVLRWCLAGLAVFAGDLLCAFFADPKNVSCLSRAESFCGQLDDVYFQLDVVQRKLRDRQCLAAVVQFDNAYFLCRLWLSPLTNLCSPLKGGVQKVRVPNGQEKFGSFKVRSPNELKTNVRLRFVRFFGMNR